MKLLILSILLTSTWALAQTSEIELGSANLISDKQASFQIDITPEMAGKVKLKYILITRRSHCAAFYVNSYSGELGCMRRDYERIEKKKTVLLDIGKSSTKQNLSKQTLRLTVKRVGSEGVWVNHDLNITAGTKDTISEKHRFAFIGTKFTLISDTTAETAIVDVFGRESEVPSYAKDSIQNHLQASQL